eukprot:6333179-Prymnesium_polylepis.1
MTPHSAAGGGLYVQGGTVTLRRVRISRAAAPEGSALFVTKRGATGISSANLTIDASCPHSSSVIAAPSSLGVVLPLSLADVNIVAPVGASSCPTILANVTLLLCDDVATGYAPLCGRDAACSLKPMAMGGLSRVMQRETCKQGPRWWQPQRPASSGPGTKGRAACRSTRWPIESKRPTITRKSAFLWEIRSNVP